MREVQFLDLWIHEVALHDVVWQGLEATDMMAAKPLSLARINMLWHILTVAKEYAVAFLDLPWAKTFELSFVTLHRICYILIVFCRTVFFYAENRSLFYENEQRGEAQQGKTILESTRNAALVERMDELRRIGNALQEKFATLVTEQVNANGDCEAMSHFAFFIKGVLNGHERRMRRCNHLAAEMTQGSILENSRNQRSPVQQPSLVAACNPKMPNDLMTSGTYTTTQSAEGMMAPQGVTMPLESDASIGLDLGEYMRWQTVLEGFVPWPAGPW